MAYRDGNRRDEREQAADRILVASIQVHDSSMSPYASQMSDHLWPSDILALRAVIARSQRRGRLRSESTDLHRAVRLGKGHPMR